MSVRLLVSVSLKPVHVDTMTVQSMHNPHTNVQQTADGHVTSDEDKFGSRSTPNTSLNTCSSPHTAALRAISHTITLASTIAIDRLAV